MDADEMLRREEFVDEDCVWLGHRFIAYRIVDDVLVLDGALPLDADHIADACALFREQVGGDTYGGGESASHGSYGFFFKRSAKGLDWALFSRRSDPFVGVELTPSEARFRSQLGDVWIVERDEVNRVRIERKSRLAER
ncbi:MAG: hypothetical protein ACTHL8_02620 [Burkholderiaceae bacterium]